MKKLLLLIFVFVLNGSVFGQTVLEVPALDDQQNPIINALTKYIVADTNAAGQQMHDVYKLQRGQIYYYNQGPVFKNPITLIADPPGETEETKPPKILITTNDEGEVPYEYCLTTFADLTVKNIAFSTITAEGDYSWANAILLQADGLRIDLEGCYFEFIGWGMIEAAVDNSTLILNKCYCRNGTVLPDGDEWVPFFIEVDIGTADSIIIRNSTFFNLQGSVVNIEQQNQVKYFEFDHNTCVNIVKGFTTEINAYLNALFTNNIFYNVGVHGGRIEDIHSGGGDHVLSGVIAVDTLVGNEPGGSGGLIPESERIMNVRNNVYFFSQGVKDYFTEFKDSIEGPPLFLDTRTQSMFDNDAEWPHFSEADNVEGDPGFVNFGGTDQMVEKLRISRSTYPPIFGFWAWDPDSVLYPEFHWAYMQWPQPEDLSYSANFTSTDGFHVGSLQWYPSELAQYAGPNTDVEESSHTPQEFSLQQNYPNPFNPSTTVNFNLSKTGEINLSVFNVLGQKVISIIDNQVISSGSHEIKIDMSDQTSGVYFLVLKQQSDIQVIKMTLMK